jgi:hypothetical protein
MKFNLVSKNNIGAATALFLVILLSQSKVFNFLLDTALGRTVLILFILVISYTNKILGVVSVLLIIIMFNSSDIGYLEGFDTPDIPTAGSMDTTNVADGPSKPNKTPPNNSDTTPQNQKLVSSVSSNGPNSSSGSSKPGADLSSHVSVPPAITTASEGFNTIDNERNIQKGKQSNSIPVNNNTRESYSNVEPFDGGAQFGSF